MALPAFAIPILAKLSPVGALLKRVPGRVWIALAIALAVVAAFIFHARAVDNLRDQSFAAGQKAAYADSEARANALTAKLNGITADISTKLRNRTDEEARAIARDADALRVRGPGKAICPRVAVTPGGPGRSGAPGGPGDDPVDQLPNGERLDLIAVPFAPLVARAEQADLNRAEVLAWRAWHRDVSAAWAKFQKDQANAR